MNGWSKPVIEGAVLAIGLMAYGNITCGYVHWEQIGLASAVGAIFALARKSERGGRQK